MCQGGLRLATARTNRYTHIQGSGGGEILDVGVENNVPLLGPQMSYNVTAPKRTKSSRNDSLVKAKQNELESSVTAEQCETDTSVKAEQNKMRIVNVSDSNSSAGSAPVLIPIEDDFHLPDHVIVPTELDPAKAVKDKPVTVLSEYVSKDQCNILYKAIPSKWIEVDVFFYESKNKRIFEIIGIKRGSNRQELCFRTLPNANRDLWPSVKRIVTYANTAAKPKKVKICEVEMIDVSGDSALTDPHIHPDHYLTYFPKDPRCEICSRCKLQEKRCKRRLDKSTFADWKEPEKYGDCVTADYKIVAERKPSNRSRAADKSALVLQNCQQMARWLAL